MAAKYRIISITLLFVSIIFLGVVYSGCVKTGCADNFCQNGGLCVDGSCACPAGYEGIHCETLWSAKFSGNWNVQESILDSNGTHQSNYSINVLPASDAKFFLINNLEGSQDSIYCQFNNVFAFTLPVQAHQDSSFIITEGSGSIDPNRLIVQMSYIFFQNGLRRNSTMQWGR